MQKIKLSLIAVLLIAFVFDGCQKQPTAKITTDKTQYVAGETVRLTSITSDADSYRWTWPDGQTSTAKNLDYATADNTGNATKTFKLEVFSKNGKKHDEASKNITIVAATGNVTFWNTSSSSPDFVEVTINETTKEILDYNIATSCNFTDCANFTLNVGSYSYTATDGIDDWSGNFSVTKNGCLLFELQ